MKLHLRSDRPIPGLQRRAMPVVTITYTFVLFCKAFMVLSKASSYLMLTVLLEVNEVVNVILPFPQ